MSFWRFSCSPWAPGRLTLPSSFVAGIVEDPQVVELFAAELTALREGFEVQSLLIPI